MARRDEARFTWLGWPVFLAVALLVMFAGCTRTAGPAAAPVGPRLLSVTPWPWRGPAGSPWAPPGFVGPTEVLELEFDRAIDAAEALGSLVATEDGAPVQLRLATDAELWLQGRQSGQRAPAAGKRLTVIPTLPLREGALLQVCEAPEGTACRGLRVVAPFGPRYGGAHSFVPGVAWVLFMTAALDPVSFRPELVTVRPPLQEMAVIPPSRSGSAIVLEGRTQPGERYEVTLDGALRDRFGRTLGKPVTIPVSISAPAFDPGGGLALPGDRGIAVRPPAVRPGYRAVGTSGLRVRARVRKVRPADFPAFRELVRWQQQLPAPEGDPPPAPGIVVRTATVRVPGRPGGMGELEVDLRSALGGGRGHALVELEPLGKLATGEQWPLRTWVQVTDLAIDAIAGEDELLIWVTSVGQGAPVPGATVELWPTGRFVTTDLDGLARLSLVGLVPGGRLLVARSQRDSVFLPEPSPGGYRPAPRVTAAVGAQLRWWLTKMNGGYYTSSPLELRGWLRAPRLLPDAPLPRRVGYELRERDGSVVARGIVPVSGSGAFAIHADSSGLSDVPANTVAVIDGPQPPREGPDLVLVALDAAPGIEGLEQRRMVQPRRPPQEGPLLSLIGPLPPVVLPEGFALEVAATGADGRPAAGARVEWTATSGGNLDSRPLDASGFHFGDARSARSHAPSPASDEEPGAGASAGRILAPRGEALTGPDGTVRLSIPGEGLGTDLPRRVQVAVTAFTPSGKASGWELIPAAVPARVSVGLRLVRTSIEVGASLEVEAKVTSVDGSPVAATPVHVRAGPASWDAKHRSWNEHPAATVCEPLAGATPVRCSFPAGVVGLWVIRAWATDAAGSRSEASQHAWVFGKDPLQDLAGPLLVPEAPVVAAGGTARFRLLSPVAAPVGLWVARGEGELRAGVFPIASLSPILEVPVPATGAGAFGVQAVPLVQRACGGRGWPWAIPGHPLGAAASQQVSWPRLKVDVRAPARTGPGEALELEVAVVDPQGAPVSGADLVGWLVDAAELAQLDGAGSPGLTDAFLMDTGRSGSWSSSRAFATCESSPPRFSDLLRRRPYGAVFGREQGSWGGNVDGARAAPAAGLRAPPTPVVSASTAASGKGVLAVTLPEAPGTYVLRVLAVSGERVGEGRATIPLRP